MVATAFAGRSRTALVIASVPTVMWASAVIQRRRMVSKQVVKASSAKSRTASKRTLALALLDCLGVKEDLHQEVA